MMRSKRLLLTVALILMVGVAAAAEGQLLFSDDFSEAPVGGFPLGWRISGREGHLAVVEDPTAKSGRAVRILGDPTRATSMMMQLSTEDPIIIVEHEVRWVKNSGLNYYVVGRPKGNNLNWYIDGSGNLGYRYTEDDRIRTARVGTLEPGWNRVRLRADYERNEVYVYLNDLEDPALGPLPFRTPVDNWNVIELSFYDSGQREDLTESYYADVKVWSVGREQEPSEDAETATGPMEIEYHEVAQLPSEWWETKQARAFAARIAEGIKSGELILSLPLGQLSVPDGILPTRLSVLARVYAAQGGEELKEAFNRALKMLIDAQYPSGGWPTIYPRYAKWDLHGDMYAASTWDEIPHLLQAILSGESPYDRILDLDPALVGNTLDRIPAKGSIKRFLYRDYASRGADWWKSEEAVRIGDNLLSWQVPSGGWWEDIAMAVLPYSPERMTRSRSTGPSGDRATFDDHGTIDPMRYLAKLYDATQEPRFREAFERGLEFIVSAQYDSGGWPQSYPDPSGYNRYVTFNDNAMVNILSFIQEVVSGEAPYGFVSQQWRERLNAAFEKGIDFILQSQIEVDGRLTAWAQQYDPFSYEPRSARAFEPIAITGNEAVGVVEFLLSLPDPSPRIKLAVLSALEWFEGAQLPDGRWARFYEIGTGRPIFAGRDGIVRYDVSEIELERQLNYAWHGTWPKSLLATAQDRGYMEAFYEDLPEYPGFRIKFHSLRNQARVSGHIPINISILHPNKQSGVQQVTVAVDDQVIYSAERMPEHDEIVLNTELLDDGTHTLTVSAVHGELGSRTQSLGIVVNNVWRMIQELQPPMDSWFGYLDFLQSAERSDGWGYETDDEERFFGDPHRLVRTTDAEEYVIWETPRLRNVDLTAYVDGDVGVDDGLILAVSSDGREWRELHYQARYEEAPDCWRQVKIEVDLDEADGANWFRLTLTEDAAKESVQIGRLILSGLHPVEAK
ncbi:MAG: pectate lyase [Limnochordia bacterium]